VNSREEFLEAVRLSDDLVGVADLGIGLPEDGERRYALPQFRKAYRSVRKLRSFYPALVKTGRDPFQLHAALLRYAMHSLRFEECNDWQKRWALYAGAACLDRVRSVLSAGKDLRVDFIEACPNFEARYPGRLGITILPGRVDRKRKLADDIPALISQGISAVVCMVEPDELEAFGVPNLLAAYRAAGLDALGLPVPDQDEPGRDEALRAFDWIETRLLAGASVLVHCAGGLGRSGTLVAAFLANRCELEASAAIATVRACRSPRAIETAGQEAFVKKMEGVWHE
jgi:protein-tyrosine phosphatase